MKSKEVKINRCTNILSDLHNDLGAFVIGLNLNLQFLEDSILEGEIESAKKEISVIKELSDKSIKKIRDIISRYRSGETVKINDLSFICTYFKSVKKYFGLDVLFENKLKNTDIKKEVLFVLYKIIKESIFNVLLHAEADTVRVQLMSKGKALYCSVHDNGKGFNVKNTMLNIKWNSLGFGFVKEIAKTVGGEILIKSIPGTGTEIGIMLPNAVKSSKKKEAD
ncbi:MAG: hypothetical protein GXP33_03130 [Spirochaetes bacterium]|nr:hypothetical protein [Spirochaetota bacterium]